MASLTLGGSIILFEMILSLFGNILVLYLLTKPQRNLLKRPLYIFLYNICLVDNAVVVFSMSFKTVDEILEDWIFGAAFCRMVEYTQRMLFRVTILMHLSIALDRYNSVVLALKPQMTRKQAKYIIAGAWFFSIVISTPLFFSFDLRLEDGNRICSLVHLPWMWVEKLHSGIDLILFFIIPLCVLLALYGSIIRFLQRRKRQSSDVGSTTAIQNTVRYGMRGVRVSVTVATVFTICWTPVVAKGFKRLVYSDVSTDRTDPLYATAMYFAFANDALVPLLYCGLDSNLQPAARKLLRCSPKIQPESVSDYVATRNE